jgi:hypothetical protein
MQGTRGRHYFGSLEAAARFGGRLSDPQPTSRSNTAPLESLERLADPAAPGGKPITQDVVLWGRCGFVPSEKLNAPDDPKA